MTYDPSNIFARILRGEIPCKKVYEDDFVLAFDDIAPKAPVHTLVLPKSPYVSVEDMAKDGKDAEILGLFRAIRTVAGLKGVSESGYRLITNAGPDSGQDVPHLHFHILGGHFVGPLVA
jgi:diadenosine tetraphosphate (Ap4A) HIT family hydrolase